MTALWPLVNDLIRFEIELFNALDARLRTDHGLTMGRFEAMQVLAGTGGCRVQDIADELVISVGGVSKLVDRVEAAGHCRRRANPDDRRSSLVELTQAGRAALAAAGDTVEAELAGRLGAVVPAEALADLGRTLATLRAHSPAQEN